MLRWLLYTLLYPIAWAFNAGYHLLIIAEGRTKMYGHGRISKRWPKAYDAIELACIWVCERTVRPNSSMADGGWF